MLCVYWSHHSQLSLRTACELMDDAIYLDFYNYVRTMIYEYIRRAGPNTDNVLEELGEDTQNICDACRCA